MAQAGSLAQQLKAVGITPPRQQLPAPDFQLQTLDGRTVKLSDYRGKRVVLNFWATFCEPCRKEMPAIETLWQKFSDKGLVVLAVAADRGRASVVEDYIHKGRFSFPVLLDPDGNVRNRYEVQALPTTYLIDTEGRFLGRAKGPLDWRSPQLQKVLLGIGSR